MTETGILLGTAISIALIHTLIGPDHYIPFIALSRANNWTVKKTVYIVLLCGTGHILGSVILGFLGIALSAGISSLINIEDIRGTLATYLLIAFGLAYTIYGIRQAVIKKPHSHFLTGGSHSNDDLHLHDSLHTHDDQKRDKKANSVFWGMFIFFVLGPCEPLIPILMYPAAVMDVFTLGLVTLSFSVCTITVMLLMTLLGIKGFQLIKFNKLERYVHALAGCVIVLCGVSVLLLPI
ncbi:MAG: sulfite exporter TauE/SafE family protein [Treponema sp.]|nr:sulfite exporter TauE/SafE family protein [Treponema sp.]